MQESYAMRGRVDDDCDKCHYCDLPFGRTRHEHDHAPVPRSAGGEDVVPICATCHDIKDRGGVRGFPADEYVRASGSLLSRGLLGDAVLGAPPQEWPDEWGELTRWERLLWARVVMLAHQTDDVPHTLLWPVLTAS